MVGEPIRDSKDPSAQKPEDERLSFQKIVFVDVLGHPQKGSKWTILLHSTNSLASSRLYPAGRDLSRPSRSIRLRKPSIQTDLRSVRPFRNRRRSRCPSRSISLSWTSGSAPAPLILHPIQRPRIPSVACRSLTSLSGQPV